ncbi:Transcriptional adapter 3-B, partial [Fragariocoptes setiger]
AKTTTMWCITKGSHDSIAVEDLDSLQVELEKTLVNVIQKKWHYEQELGLITPGGHSIDNSSQDSSRHSELAASNGTSSVSGDSRPANNSNSEISNIVTITTKNLAAVGANSESAASANSNHLSTPVVINSSVIPICRPAEDRNNSIQATLSNSVPVKRNHHSKTNKKSAKRPRPGSTLANVGNYDTTGLLARNDVPEKFWPFVSRYCVEPTKEQFETLEQMLVEYQDTSEYFKIPNLGIKKTNVRSPKKGGADVRSPGGSQGLSPDRSLSSSGKKKKSSDAKSSASNRANSSGDNCFGALTQRLVSCLIEEDLNSLSEAETEVGIAAVNAHNSVHIAASSSSPTTGNSGASLGRKKPHNAQSNGLNRIPSLKNLDLGSVKQLEKNIRRELERHQILNKSDEVLSIEDDDDDDDEDEIVRELKSCQSELSVIQAFNEATLGRMMSQAKKRAELEEARRSLDAINIEVIECYQKLLQAKQKKRNPTKRERDIAKRAVREQEVIFKRCDELASSLSID